MILASRAPRHEQRQFPLPSHNTTRVGKFHTFPTINRQPAFRDSQPSGWLPSHYPMLPSLSLLNFLPFVPLLNILPPNQQSRPTSQRIIKYSMNSLLDSYKLSLRIAWESLKSRLTILRESFENPLKVCQDSFKSFVPRESFKNP